MSTILPSLFSSFPLCFRHKPTVHVCGLLGTTYITGVNGLKGDDDHWMAIDFVTLRHLIGARDEHGKWLCGTPIRTHRGFLLGDPACDRIVLDHPPFETVTSGKPSTLAIKFLLEVREASSMLSTGDILVLVLVGHGDDGNHSFLVGNKGDPQCFQLEKEHLEDCVHGTKGDILLISTACFSDSWTSQCWTLLAAARVDQEAPPIVASGSKEHHGGFFTNALLTEYADESKIRPPYPGLVDEAEHRAEQKEHDFGPTKTHPSPRLPKRRVQAIVNWIHRFRDDIGQTHTSADMIFYPCSNDPHRLPFASLISGRTPFHRLVCIPPSLPDDSFSSHTTTHRPAIPSPLPQNTSADSEPPVNWSANDEAELAALAADFLLYMPPSITSERGLIVACMIIIYGPSGGSEPFNPVRKSKLLSQLKKREYHRELALAIAKNLGWEKAVHEIGEPGGKQRQMATMHALRREAEASGCLVSSLLIPEISLWKQWAGAAGWLARVWEAAGCPIVSPNEWQIAVEQSQLALDVR